jgi:NADPH:quinone reductase-like Zn-dependent oxidoreductase
MPTYALAHEASAMPLPAPLSFVEAAGPAGNGADRVEQRLLHEPPAARRSLLVHGGASGIGTTAIQLASNWGATVYATAGTDEKCRLCESLGAKRAINYRTEDFETVLRDAGGVDVVLDMVGKPYFEKNLTILKDLGRLSYIAFLQGSRIEGDFTRLMLKRISVSGSTLRIRTDAHKGMLAAEAVKHVWPWIAAGKFKPEVSGVFTLAEADAAHAKMEAADHSGKIILQIVP